MTMLDILKTNFFKQSKVALSFRLDPGFLDVKEYTEVPFGVLFVVGSEFRGFHVRFRYARLVCICFVAYDITGILHEEELELFVRTMLLSLTTIPRRCLMRIIIWHIPNNKRTRVFVTTSLNRCHVMSND